MPLRLDIKRKLSARSDRVKCVDLHPTEPWVLVSLYNGNVHIWNHESQTHVKSFEVCDLPVRAARFVPRKNWVISGSDDMTIRVYNYNTLERVHSFEAHTDYIRSIAVHPSQPYILTSSDDMLIKLWDWDKKWNCAQVFEGHTHYVMQIVINPKDNNQFASASLDHSIKVWQLGSSTPNFTLDGHDKGVNCVDYYSGGDKPYLISGADDRQTKIWDYQNKTCVQTLEGHSQNIVCASFHPELPIIMTGSEDGTVKIWHANTYRLETTLNYGMERVWCCAALKGSNNVALGYDEGAIMIKLGREEPAMSMDANGKIIWAKHSEVQQANLKALPDQDIKDGERLSLSIKDMGSCEVYPQNISHNTNGRFVVVCGDGEYIIYTAMALRNKAFGSALEFIWANDSTEYAVRENNTTIKLHKNFKERKQLKPDFGAEQIFGGHLLGVRTNQGLAFYDWETCDLIRRIEITPKNVFWSDNGDLCCIATEESFYILKYDASKLDEAKENPDLVTEDGITDVFSEDISEIEEVVKTGVWVGDCFIYTNTVNRLNYYVGGEIVTIAHLDRTLYILGYMPDSNRLYLGDKEINVVSYSLLLSVLEYQTAVMRQDFETADKVLPSVPREQRTRVAHFLEKQGFKPQAMAVTADPEHKFELALSLGDLKVAYQMAKEEQAEQKWKQLADLATKKCEFGLAQECLKQAQDFGGLLLMATSAGNADMVQSLAENAAAGGKSNVAFLSYFITGQTMKCLDLLIDTHRLPEAAFFARTYAPSQISRVVGLWKEHLSRTNKKGADALADPEKYENLFPGMAQSLVAEKYLAATEKTRPASHYPLVPSNDERNVLEESEGFQENQQGTTSPAQEPEVVPEVNVPLLKDEVAPEEVAAPPAPEVEQTPEIAEEPPVIVDLPPSEEPPVVIDETEIASEEEPAPSPPAEEDVPATTVEEQDDEKDLELDMEGLELDDIDTTDVNLDDEDFLKDD